MPGDANDDGRVDVSDLGILAANYGLTAGAAWDLGDFNGDGAVDVGDLGILAAHYSEAGGLELTSSHHQSSGVACGAIGLPLILGLFLVDLRRAISGKFQ